MGHVESGGAAGRPDRERLWELWRALIKPFGAWMLIPSSFVTPGAWGYFGVDFLSGFRANPSTHKTFDALGDLDGATFDALSALANLNARRQEQMLKAVVIGYLTIPVTVLAVVAEVAGDSLLVFARAHMRDVIIIAAMAALGPLGYFLSSWRSHQIVGVLDLIRIERGQAPYTALELRDD
jgi:hypothetical protein